jgi:copper transporter 1
MPYFHTSGGDNLLFESWAPTSPGAIGGACIAIFFFATFERLVNGFRGRLEAYWVSKYYLYHYDYSK